MRARHVVSGWLVLFASWQAAGAEPPEVLLDRLNYPFAVAIQPKTADVFVAESGAGQVVRIVDGKPQPVIVDFPLAIHGDQLPYKVGPLGLAFVSEDVLVVGGGGQADGVDVLRVYKLPKPGEPALKAAEMTTSFKLTATESMKGVGNYYGLAVNTQGIFATTTSSDRKGWVARAEVSGGKLEGFKRFIATQEQTKVSMPVGITLSPGGQLLVAQAGAFDASRDSVLAFYDPRSGKKLLEFAMELHDVVGLAFSPQTKALFALDFARQPSDAGGLFELSADRSSGKQVLNVARVAPLQKPTGLAFGADGTLYVTVLGTSSANNEQAEGKLLKFPPGF